MITSTKIQNLTATRNITIYDNLCENDYIRDTGSKISLFDELIRQIKQNNRYITELDIRSKLTKTEFKELLITMKNNHVIQELTLRSSTFHNDNDDYDLSDETAYNHLAYFLKNNNNMKSLTLYHTGINDEGAIALSNILKEHNVVLKNLKICGHNITEKGSLFLIKMLTCNRSLENIEIKYNGINGLARVCLIAQLPYISSKLNVAGNCDSIITSQISFNETFNHWPNECHKFNYHSNPLQFKVKIKNTQQARFLDIMHYYGLGESFINRTANLLSVFKAKEQQLIDSYPNPNLDKLLLDKSKLLSPEIVNHFLQDTQLDKIQELLNFTREHIKKEYINTQYDYIKHLSNLAGTPQEHILTEATGPTLVEKKLIKPIIFTIVEKKPKINEIELAKLNAIQNNINRIKDRLHIKIKALANDELLSSSFTKSEKLGSTAPDSLKLSDACILTECHCCPELSREAGNIRGHLEQQLIKEIQNQLPNKTNLVELVCVGAGPKNPESLIVLAKLLEAGYSNIKLHLVDLSFTNNLANQISINMYCLYLQQNDIAVTIDQGIVTLFPKFAKKIGKKSSLPGTTPIADVTINVVTANPTVGNHIFILIEDIVKNNHQESYLEQIAKQYTHTNTNITFLASIFDSSSEAEVAAKIFKICSIGEQYHKETFAPINQYAPSSNKL